MRIKVMALALGMNVGSTLQKPLSPGSTHFCGGENIVLAGDFNAYAKEDSIKFIQDSGFTSVQNLTKVEPPEYSYVFDGQWGTLDYAFVPGSCAGNVQASGIWKVNADEPSLFDYDFNFRGNSPEQVDTYFDVDIPFRFSDHDPIVLRAQLTTKGECKKKRKKGARRGF